MVPRKVSRILHPKASQGFLGKGHTAIPVIGDLGFEQTDPFILLMDDILDLPGTGSVGGPHPHAGFETVTLVLEGDSNNPSKTMQTGGLEWMTAGSGIVHSEEISTHTNMRILQLWLTLPKEKRWTAPKWQELHPDNVPVKKDGHTEIRVYSGTSQGLTAPTLNETPTTLVDFRLDAGYTITQEIPASYNGFTYIIAGSVRIGAELTEASAHQVAWLDRPVEQGPSSVTFSAGAQGARFILYAGEPQRVPVVSHGPFIGDTQEDIVRLYNEYRQGRMGHVRDLPDSQVLHHV